MICSEEPARKKIVLEAASKNAAGLRLRNQLCYAHLYLGLYYEALGETVKSAAHMKKSAVDYRMDHYMGMVAQLHHKLRSRPNIIFLFADDQRADTIGAHRESPHQDSKSRCPGGGRDELSPKLLRGFF
jgi:hypothetical protein